MRSGITIALAVAAAPLGERHAVVEAEQRRPVGSPPAPPRRRCPSSRQSSSGISSRASATSSSNRSGDTSTTGLSVGSPPMDPEALLEGLDEAQRAAVTSTAMPLVVLAPAGSGKTRVLTRRIAHRVATGAADPRHVLALTFTRKAAGELDDRLRRLGLRGDAATGTFHAVAWATLRTRWADQGRRPPALLDRKGPVLRELAPTVPRQGQAHRRRRAGDRDRVGQGPHGHARRLRRGGGAPARRQAGRSGRDLVAEAYAAYEHRKRRGGLVDFDDLLALVARALEEDETLRGGAAVAVPPPLRRRVAGREPAAVPAAARRGGATATTSPPSATRTRRSTGGTAPTPASSSTSTAGGRRPR